MLQSYSVLLPIIFHKAANSASHVARCMYIYVRVCVYAYHALKLVCREFPLGTRISECAVHVLMMSCIKQR